MNCKVLVDSSRLTAGLGNERMKMELIKQILGGRPMKCNGGAFVDNISGEYVKYFTDTLGRKWLATSAWSLFRVPRN